MSKPLADSKRKILSESEERFRDLVIATSDVIYRMSPDWSVMQHLDGGNFLADTGEPITNWLDKYIHPLDQDLVRQATKEASQNKTMFKLEHRVLRVDGTLGWTFSSAIPVFDNDGHIIEWFGAARDITYSNSMKESLQTARDEAEQHKRLNEIVTSNTPDLVYVFDLDYKFTFANPALLNMWGKTWDEAVGKRLLDNGYEPWHAECMKGKLTILYGLKK